jgi:lipoate-protein ligase A
VIDITKMIFLFQGTFQYIYTVYKNSSGKYLTMLGVTNVIQEQSADQRKQRQEDIKRDKESQRKAMGAAQKIRMKAFVRHKDAEDEANAKIISTKLMAMKGRMVGKAWSNRASCAKIKESESIDDVIEVEPISKTLTRARGPYNKSDPLHNCHLNKNCHRRNINHQRCGLHNLDKEELKKKQKVHTYILIR